MHINERIFSLLAKKKCTQQYFAEYLGVSDKTVSTWKSRGSTPPAEYIHPIAKFFGVSVEYILTGEEDEPISKPLNNDENRTMEYYRRLNLENQDYIKGEMVRLIKEQDKGNSSSLTKGVAT